VKGFTQDKRFAHFDRFVEKLEHISATALEHRSI